MKYMNEKIRSIEMAALLQNAMKPPEQTDVDPGMPQKRYREEIRKWAEGILDMSRLEE